jgi:pyruvate dehydrogenase E2 component (dihydrolipoamide acetyltransferase)
MEWMTAANAQRSVSERLLPAALLLRATIRAVSDVPEVNGHWIDGRAQTASTVHLGVAISLRGGGLVAPAIRDAQRLDLDGVMRSLADLVTRARAGALRSSELSEATLTVTNLGDQGVDTVFAVIVPPQVAIVGFGRIVDRPSVVDGQIVARRMVTVSLSFDHRVLDGHRAGLFLAALERRLREPEML